MLICCPLFGEVIKGGLSLFIPTGRAYCKGGLRYSLRSVRADRFYFHQLPVLRYKLIDPFFYWLFCNGVKKGLFCPWVYRLWRNPYRGLKLSRRGKVQVKLRGQFLCQHRVLFHAGHELFKSFAITLFDKGLHHGSVKGHLALIELVLISLCVFIRFHRVYKSLSGPLIQVSAHIERGGAFRLIAEARGRSRPRRPLVYEGRISRSLHIVQQRGSGTPFIGAENILSAGLARRHPPRLCGCRIHRGKLAPSRFFRYLFFGLCQLHGIKAVGEPCTLNLRDLSIDVSEVQMLDFRGVDRHISLTCRSNRGSRF